MASDVIGYDHDVIVEIDNKAIKNNINILQNMSIGSKTLAFVKSNAYGHGIINFVAEALNNGINDFAVAGISEFLNLRKQYTDINIVVGYCFYDLKKIQLLIDNSADLIISAPEHIELLQIVKATNKVRIWLKFNTGMHRMGLDITKIKTYLAKLSGLAVVDEIIVMSHLSDSCCEKSTLEQYNLFEEYTANLGLARSLANSAAIINFPQTKYDWVRPGISLYGVSPLQQKTATDLGLAAVMTVKARIISMNIYSSGDKIGYGSTYELKQRTNVAVISFGYANGYPYNIFTTAYVVINGVKCPVIGAISMNLITVDVSNVKDISVGDYAILWGKSYSVEELSQAAKVIPYSILTQLSLDHVQMMVYKNDVN